MDNDIEITKNFINELYGYSSKINDMPSSISNWNYLMLQILEASFKGEFYIEYCSEGDYVQECMVKTIQKNEDRLKELGYDVRIRTQNLQDYTIVFACLIWK